MKKPVTVTILGSTGSIGVSSLNVIRASKGAYRVMGLSARSNIERFAEQVKEFRPKQAAVVDSRHSEKLEKEKNVQYSFGTEALSKLATDGADILINALVGASGIVPTVRAAATGKRIALANKESLVAAGDLIARALKKSGGEMIPVDSEHSAIFQCLLGTKPEEVEKIIITASGGPFRKSTKAQLAKVKVAEALNHPTWQMGAKITIDSATLMNKGLEVIEAHHLFNIPYDKIEVVIHPQSIIHSMVQFVDGSVMAHLGHPDMKMPIQYALSYPDKRPLAGKRLDFSELGRLDFEKPDLSRFPCLGLAYAAGRAGGTLPAVMNAANEVAVTAFLEGRLSFCGIPKVIEKAMGRHRQQNRFSLAELIDTDQETRRKVSEWV